MAEKKRFRRRLAIIPTFLSITLVLFLAGLFGIFILHVNALKNIARENVQLNIFFKDDVEHPEIKNIQNTLAREHFVKEATFISKEEALKIWERDMGEDPQEIIGFNPIPNSIKLHFKSGYVSLDSLNHLKTSLLKNINIKDVDYNEMMVENIDKNVRVVGIVIISLAVLMSLVSIGLINNTIRLTLYSKRFLIKSMQLVGATQSFIRRPFLYSGFLLGLSSGIFAGGFLIGGLFILTQQISELKIIQNYTEFAILLGGIILLGILISILSSYLAVNKYLKMKLDDLF